MDKNNIISDTREKLRSERGRNILTFLVFLVISILFWLVMQLNESVQHEYNIPIVITKLPDEVTILHEGQPNINVTIRDKGISLLHLAFGSKPELKVRYDEFLQPNDTTLLLNSAQLYSLTRNAFSMGTDIVSLHPDSLRINITHNPGIRLPIRLNANISTLPQYVRSGNIQLSDDSVTVYSNSAAIHSLKSIVTQPLTFHELADTAIITAHLCAPPGTRVIPSTVTITVPVEPLVAKSQTANITVRNCPDNKRLVTFPSKAEIRYLVPKSAYANENADIDVYVDYNDIDAGGTLPVLIANAPSYFQSLSINPEHVDYVIEQ